VRLVGFTIEIGYCFIQILVYNGLRRRHHFDGLCIHRGKILAEIGAKEIGKDDFFIWIRMWTSYDIRSSR